MPRRGQGVSSKARKPAGPKDNAYKPSGAIPYPLLGDGTMYRPGMAVALTAQDADMDWERVGAICWVTWQAGIHAWEATVDWGGVDEWAGATKPGSKVWLLDLKVPE